MVLRNKRIFLLSACLGIQVIGQADLAAAKEGYSNSDNINARVSRLNDRVDFNFQQGTINREQANTLHNELTSIGKDADNARKTNNGVLKPNFLRDLESRLNQQLSIIKSYDTAGTRNVTKGNVLGPDWQSGPDGAQDPNALKRKMKAEERQEARQYDQAQMQLKEQQQQKYEQEILNKFGQQRPDILRKKEQLDQQRKDTGAN